MCAMKVVSKKQKRVDPKAGPQGKRYYFETQNGMRVSIRGRNGLLAVKHLPSWVLL